MVTSFQAIDFCRSFEQVKIQMKQIKKEQDVDTEENEVTVTTPTNKVYLYVFVITGFFEMNLA